MNRYRGATVLLVGVLLTALAACGSDDTSSGGRTKITLALDYLPNNAGFAGFYAAQSQGFFADHGLDVTILPYSETSADVLVGAGQAQFGTIDEGGLMIDDAAGSDLVSIMAIMQHEAERLAVSTDAAGSVSSPRDLAGRTFGGYGVPIEQALNDAMITADGGTPDYKTVTLGASVYDSLQNGDVDWAIPYATDDIAWAAAEGHPWKTFAPTDYGVPDFYDKIIFGSSAYTDAHPDVTRAFVAAAQQGYTWAAQHPDDAVTGQAHQVDGAFDVGQQTTTAKLLASDYWLAPDGTVGPQDPARWTAFADFLVAQKVLKDSGGAVLTAAPDVSGWVTDEYLPGESG